ncbi:Trigger factor [bioreactor metagenome]|uniref:Trigger factor n=1 Tax=bioreactor metagenome TaxID=1076179 RepID=A0A645EVA4_9ZZZZ
MVERQINHMLRDISYQLSMSGLSLEDYVKYTGTDMNGLKESYRAEALARVKTQLVVEAIAKKEGVTCSDDDLKAIIAEYAEGSGKSAEDFEKSLSEDDREYLSDNVVARKAVKIVTDSAVLVKGEPVEKKSAKKTAKKADGEGETAEKPAKKTAKKTEPKE